MADQATIAADFTRVQQRTQQLATSVQTLLEHAEPVLNQLNAAQQQQDLTEHINVTNINVSRTAFNTTCAPTTPLHALARYNDETHAIEQPPQQLWLQQMGQPLTKTMIRTTPYNARQPLITVREWYGVQNAAGLNLQDLKEQTAVVLGFLYNEY